MEPSPKHFKKRDAILSCLQRTKAHPSAEGLHQMLQAEHPDISLATVYRNLALFKNQGRIISLGTVGGIERFDANTEPHVHFICDSCGDVQDLPKMDPPENLATDVAKATGGTVASVQLSFSGTCRDCLKKLS